MVAIVQRASKYIGGLVRSKFWKFWSKIHYDRATPERLELSTYRFKVPSWNVHRAIVTLFRLSGSIYRRKNVHCIQVFHWFFPCCSCIRAFLFKRLFIPSLSSVDTAMPPPGAPRGFTCFPRDRQSFSPAHFPKPGVRSWSCYRRQAVRFSVDLAELRTSFAELLTSKATRTIWTVQGQKEEGGRRMPDHSPAILS